MNKLKSQTKIKVEYSHTDKMGYVHHSQYLVYYEFARLEFFRQMGLSYRDIEENGILMPVISSKIKYLKPAFYDEQLIINSTFENIGAKLIFKQKMVNEDKELINKGEIIVVCVDSNSRKPLKEIKKILNIFQKVS